MPSEWEITEIVGERRANGTHEFRVRWKNSWVAARDVRATQLIRKFRRRQLRHWIEEESVEILPEAREPGAEPEGEC